MTTTRRGHTRAKPGGGQTHVSTHQMKTPPRTGRAPRATFNDRAKLAKDAGLATLAGTLVFGVTRMLMLTSLAMVMAVSWAALTMIGLQFRKPKRRRASMTTRTKRWAKRKTKLAYVHGRQRVQRRVRGLTAERVVARSKRGKGGRRVNLRKPPVVKVDGMKPGNWPSAKGPSK